MNDNYRHIEIMTKEGHAFIDLTKITLIHITKEACFVHFDNGSIVPIAPDQYSRIRKFMYWLWEEDEDVEIPTF